MPIERPRSAPTSGPAMFQTDYLFSQGDRVEAATLPYAESAPAPFRVARWSVAPGRANDADIHESREVWLVAAGQGELVWADNEATIAAGDVIAFDSRVPHQVRNHGTEPLQVFSVYWVQAADVQSAPEAGQ
jgi:mannose-6-phosphate isomerase-like protein (cupin superfamily)